MLFRQRGQHRQVVGMVHGSFLSTTVPGLDIFYHANDMIGWNSVETGAKTVDTGLMLFGQFSNFTCNSINYFFFFFSCSQV